MEETKDEEVDDDLLTEDLDEDKTRDAEWSESFALLTI